MASTPRSQPTSSCEHRGRDEDADREHAGAEGERPGEPSDAGATVLLGREREPGGIDEVRGEHVRDGGLLVADLLVADLPHALLLAHDCLLGRRRGAFVPTYTTLANLTNSKGEGKPLRWPVTCPHARIAS